MRVAFSAIIMVLLVVTVGAQQPSPCSSADLRAAMAEARLEANRVELNTLRARLKAAEQDLARQQGQTADIGQRLVSAQNSAAALQSSNESAQQKIAALGNELTAREKAIAALTIERDNGLSKIKTANGRWNCKVLHMGCIGER